MSRVVTLPCGGAAATLGRRSAEGLASAAQPVPRNLPQRTARVKSAGSPAPFPARRPLIEQETVACIRRT
ncbi:MAG: hypothetical protein D6725_10415 [Planctomycetota bacterium]|nr:MAG: hypothetical protein D6725_10415 [Planctomycetota bacterium]